MFRRPCGAGGALGSGGSGDIVVTAPILWSSNNNLTLDAYHSLLINADIPQFPPG